MSKRAGYSTWSLQAREIRNCIQPNSLKLLIPLHNKESEFWSTIQVQVNTALADYIDEGRKCTSCSAEDHKENCPKGPGKTSGSTRVGTGTGTGNVYAGKECYYRKKYGYIERDCRIKCKTLPMVPSVLSDKAPALRDRDRKPGRPMQGNTMGIQVPGDEETRTTAKELEISLVSRR